MERTILKLISKKKIVNGKEYVERPSSMLKGKIFDYLKRKIFEKNFNKSPKFTIDELMIILDKTERLYMDKNYAYQIDINDNPRIILQIVHPIMICDIMEMDKIKDFGFSVYIVFDTSSKEESRNLKKFQNIFSKSEYLECKQDNKIHLIAINCGTNKKLVKSFTSNILSDVFEKPLTTKYQFSLHNNGKIE